MADPALSVADVLERAAKLIEPKGAWTRGCYARAKGRRGVTADSPDAVSWCIIGSIKRAGGYKTDEDATPAIAVLYTAFATPPVWMHKWNDMPSRRKSQVVAKLREAAAKAREQGL